MSKLTLPVIIIFLIIFQGVLFAQTPSTRLWVPNRNVMTMKRNGNVLYLGGDFTRIGPRCSYGGVLDNACMPDTNYALPNSAVRCVIPDGAGGWFIAGDFTKVGDSTRNTLAHLNVSGHVTAWNPQITGYAHTLLLSGDTLFIGGIFTAVGGQSRQNLAAVNANTGTIFSWNPGCNNDIQAFRIIGTKLYIGGDFTTIGGQTRGRLASFDRTTGLITSWNPNPNNYVTSLSSSHDTLFVGGAFNFIGGQSRTFVAAFNTTLATNNVTAWNVSITGTGAGVYVNDLAITGKRLFICGGFETVGGQPRKNLAAVDVTLNTGNLLSWYPTNMTGGGIDCLAIKGNSLVFGGYFIDPGMRIASVNINTGALDSWTPDADSYVHALAVNGSSVYVGGVFNAIGGVKRSKAGAINLLNGELTCWNPDIDHNGDIRAIAFSNDTVYLAGLFLAVGGVSRKSLAAVNNSNGALLPWKTDMNGSGTGGSIADIIVHGNELIVAGGFNTTGYVVNRLASFYRNLNTNNTRPWNPGFLGTGAEYLNSILLKGDTLYAAGKFTQVDGQPRNNLAAFSTSANTNSLLPWDPNSNAMVNKLQSSGETIYASGGFGTVGGQVRKGIVAIEAGSGNVTPWYPNPSNGLASTSIGTIGVWGNVLYCYGAFNNIGGQPRTKYAALDLGSSAAALPWFPPFITSGTGCFYIDSSLLMLGGAFTSSNTYKAHAFMEAFTPVGTTSFDPIIASSAIGSVCPGTAVTLTVNEDFAGNPANLYWYSGSCGGTLVGTGSTIMVNPGTTTTYFLRTQGTCPGYGGCNSITVNVYPNPQMTVTPDTDLCLGDSVMLTASGAVSYNWGALGLGTAQTVAPIINTTYTVIGTDTHGCKDTADIHVQIRPVSSFTQNHTICESGVYTWHGVNYSTPGTYTVNYLSVNGCDSSYTLHLSVNPVYAFTENHTVCENEIYSWHGTDYSTEGTYTANYSTVNGCDSSYTLHLSVNPVYAFTENHDMCEGESYSWHGTNYALAGTYTDTHISTNGCDSSYTLHLNVNPIFAFTENHSMCEGEVYTWHGVNYSTPGTYTVNYLSVNGCDSSYTLHLSVNPVYAFTENHTICENAVYTWHGTNYSIAGMYTANYSTVTGCDSSYTLYLSVNPVYEFTENYSMCEGEVYTWHGVNYYTAGTYMANYLSAIGCDSNYILNLSVTPLNVSVHVDGLIITSNQNNATYQWLDCNEGLTPINGETNQGFTPDENGNYAVLITSGSCSDTSECIEIQNVGLTSKTISEINVYPNPFSNELLIVSEDQKQWDVQIFNALGQNVFNGLAVGKTSVSTIVFAPGLYMIQLSSNDFRYYKKLIKE